jgi:hypothetical protein
VRDREIERDGERRERYIDIEIDGERKEIDRV